MLPVVASVTEQLANWTTHVVRDVGLPGIFLLMLLESACIPIPSEATMLFAGFNVATGHWTLFAVTAAGVLGNLAGSWLAYGVGRAGRLELLEKHGRALHVTPKRLQQADRWFERWGGWAVFVTRMLPIVRTFISLPAGVARMPFWRFTIATLAGCIPWVLALAAVGKAARSDWTKWKDNLHYVDYAVLVLVVMAIAYYGYRWWRGRSRGAGGEPAADPGAS
jgi:membrane protein DedA with SNARE-associated domain